MAAFLTELRERRVLPALGVYVASCWVLVEILDRLVERYELSASLTDLVFWGLYSLLPAVALVAWSYGRPGKDTATKAQKIGVPINLVATTALLLALYSGKTDGPVAAPDALAESPAPAPAAEATATPTDSRRRLAVYFYENESGDPELDWLQYGATELLAQDLTQDPHIAAIAPFGFWGNGYYQQLAARGFPSGIGAPASLLREITRDGGQQYFIDGQITREGEELVLETRLWDTESLSVVLRDIRRGWDIYTMLDETSVAVRSVLEVPSLEQPDYLDLPLAETYGESQAALQAYIAGRVTRMIDSDYVAALGHMDEALEEDPTFVMALLIKGQLSLQIADLPGAAEALRRAQDFDYRLPPADQALVTANLYRARGEGDKLVDLVRLQVELTDESRWHVQLAQLLLIADEREQARFHFKAALERDRYNTGIYLVLADLERSLGNIDGAIELLEQYKALRPDDIDAEIRLGDLVRDSGDLSGAEARYRQAQLIDASAITPVLRIHQLAARQGNIDQARVLLEEARDIARAPAQLAQIHEAASQLEERMGRIELAIAQRWAAEPYLAQAQPPFFVVLSVHLEVARLHLLRDDIDAARAVLQDARALVPEPPFSGFINSMEVPIAVREGRFDDARSAIDRLQATIDAMAFDYMQFQVPLLEGQIAYFEEDYGRSAELMGEGQALMERSFVVGVLYNAYMLEFLATYGHAQVLAGELESAELTLNRLAQLDPSSPLLWLARARLYEARDESGPMRESLERAMDAWSGADPEYVNSRDAQEIAATLGLAGSP